MKALGYYRQRKIEVRAEKGTLLSGTDDGDVTDPEDPNFYVRSLKFKRGQLAYFLPDPEWLGECKDDGRQPMKPGDLEPDDWWLAVILDCAEVKYTDGSAACVLRVAVSPML